MLLEANKGRMIARTPMIIPLIPLKRVVENENLENWYLFTVAIEIIELINALRPRDMMRICLNKSSLTSIKIPSTIKRTPKII